MKEEKKESILIDCPLQKKEVKKLLPILQKFIKKSFNSRYHFFESTDLLNLEYQLFNQLKTENKTVNLRFSENEYEKLMTLIHNGIYFLYIRKKYTPEYYLLFQLAYQFLSSISGDESNVK